MSANLTDLECKSCPRNSSALTGPKETEAGPLLVLEMDPDPTCTSTECESTFDDAITAASI